MLTIGLPEFVRLPREEYIMLLQDIALDAGIVSENIEQLLKTTRRGVHDHLTRGGPTHIKLSVEKEFAIELDSHTMGRVFELSGPSDRNKTTGLIYLATICGIDWEATKQFLDKDNKVYNTATQIVIPALARGQKAYCELNSQDYDVSVLIEQGQASISVRDSFNNSSQKATTRTVSVQTVQDWAEYRKFMSEICDAQFVGKSRDFVGQVTLEESKDLQALCVGVSTRIGLLLQHLEQLSQDQKSYLTRQERDANIRTTEGTLRQLQDEIGDIDRDIRNTRQLIQSIDELMTLRTTLDNDSNAQVVEVLKVLMQAEVAQEQVKRKQELERQVQVLDRDLARVRQQFAEQAPLVDAVNQAVQSLSHKIVARLKDLTSITSQGTDTLRAIASKDYDQIISFCQYALVTRESIDLLETILSATADFNKNIVIPHESAEGRTIRLGDLEKQWRSSMTASIATQALHPEILATYNSLQAGQIQSSQDMRRLESAVETLRGLVQDKERLLGQHRSALENIQTMLQSLLGGDDLEGYIAHGEQLKEALPPNQLEKITRVEQLSHAIGYYRPWQRDPSTLQELRREYNTQLHQATEYKEDKERIYAQYREYLTQLQQAEVRSDDARPQSSALEDFQYVVDTIQDYLKEYQRRRETIHGLTSDTRLNDLANRLGENREKVHRTLNQVIRQRCPVMYKNRGKGPVRLNVETYDFLTGDKNVPDLQSGEWTGGGGDSAMTVLGLATRASGSRLGTILLVDEFNDAETFKDVVCTDIAKLEQLAFAIFVRHDPQVANAIFRKIR